MKCSNCNEQPGATRKRWIVTRQTSETTMSFPVGYAWEQRSWSHNQFLESFETFVCQSCDEVEKKSRIKKNNLDAYSTVTMILGFFVSFGLAVYFNRSGECVFFTILIFAAPAIALFIWSQSYEKRARDTHLVAARRHFDSNYQKQFASLGNVKFGHDLYSEEQWKNATSGRKP
jgi:hypothetical protein